MNSRTTPFNTGAAPFVPAWGTQAAPSATWGALGYGYQAAAPSYGQPAAGLRYGHQAAAPSYAHQASAPNYGHQAAAPRYDYQAASPSYSHQAAAPRYGHQAAAPCYGHQATAPGYAQALVPSAPQRRFARQDEARDPSSLVATEAELSQVLRHLACEELLCVDCEGADLSKGSWREGVLQEDQAVPLHGQLCLIQIGTPAGEAYAIDILELGAQAFDLGLRNLLENPNVIKVVHDFRQDVDALWHQFRVRPQGVFDCQLCDIMIRRLQGHKTGYVQGSAKLLSNYDLGNEEVLGYGLLTQEQKLRIHARFSEDRHLWERRPLPPDMVQYAKADVLPLSRLHWTLLQKLSGLVSDERLAWRLVLLGSSIYDDDFAALSECRCRLCCNAGDNARFDGNRVFTRMAREIEPWVLRQLWRLEDDTPLKPPGPSKFYVDEFDQSVPLPGAG